MVERFEDLPRTEQIDIFINRISGDEKEEEILFLLALFTAHNINGDNVERFIEYTTEQLVDLLNENLINGDYDEEQEAWELVIDTLGIDKVWDIIENIDEYMQRYLKMKRSLETIEEMLLDSYTRL